MGKVSAVTNTWFIVGMVTAETERAQGVPVVQPQLKSLIPRMGVWSGQDLGSQREGQW